MPGRLHRNTPASRNRDAFQVATTQAVHEPREDVTPMTTLFILTVVLGIIPAASIKFGVDSRDLRKSDVRSLVS